ncbi:hypothetical protein, partial [Nocardioides sp.]|uniref:HNH endonuclease n=1 Tax=Nocardioides sp. TaxID=35761 RepID=UPI002734FC0A
VHHLNGIKDDNRIVNLKVMPMGEHSPHLVNQSLQSKIRDLELRVMAVEADNALLQSQLSAIRDSAPNNNVNEQHYNTPGGSSEESLRYSPNLSVMGEN